jgi:hypothetical protein
VELNDLPWRAAFLAAFLMRLGSEGVGPPGTDG